MIEENIEKKNAFLDKFEYKLGKIEFDNEFNKGGTQKYIINWDEKLGIEFHTIPRNYHREIAEDIGITSNMILGGGKLLKYFREDLTCLCFYDESEEYGYHGSIITDKFLHLFAKTLPELHYFSDTYNNIYENNGNGNTIMVIDKEKYEKRSMHGINKSYERLEQIIKHKLFDNFEKQLLSN